MDCGVRVDAGKPLIIAEDHLENPDKYPQQIRGRHAKAFKFKPLHWRANKWPLLSPH